MGVISPYLGWWLSQMVDPVSVKYLLACFYGTLIITPSLWGHAAFSSNRPGHWLSYGTLLTAVFALGLSQIESSSVIAGCFLMIAFGLFYNPLVSLVDAIAYAHTEDAHAYSRIRLFGSLGFLVFSSTVGGMFVLSHPVMFPFVVSMVMLLAWVASWPYRKPLMFGSAETPCQTTPALTVLWKLKNLWLVSVLSQVSFVMYYVFFAMHLKSLGFENVWVGLLVGLATLAEIVAFWKIKWFFSKATPWVLISLASLASVVRWLGIGFVEEGVWGLLLLALMQCLHALGFSVFHTACLKIMHQETSSQDMGLAQGLYNALGYGVGGVLGVLLGTTLWGYGGVYVFAGAALLSFLLAGFAFMCRPRPSLEME